ncbi:hypothetical protein DBA20_18485 [Pandoraea capi]|nr:hypothetical protein [Pandoraea capi]
MLRAPATSRERDTWWFFTIASMTSMQISTGALRPTIYASLLTARAANEPHAPAAPTFNTPRKASETLAHTTDSTEPWAGHTRQISERRLADDQWRRTLQNMGALPDSAPLSDRPHPLNDRLHKLTQVWLDVLKNSSFRSGDRVRTEFDSLSESIRRQQADVYRNVVAQMTPLVGPDAAHDSAQETSKLVAIARRVDEIDAWIASREGRRTPSDLLEQRNVMAAALVNHDVYFDEAVPHILPARVQRLRSYDRNGPGQSGYFGAVYTDSLGDKIIVANRGTEMGISGRSGIDWQQNIRQAFGFSSAQYDEAMNMAKSLAREHSPSKLIFTGHSLGGGLASAQTSVVPGANGLTFDTAGLHNRTVARHSAMPASTRVKAYHVNGEALSVVQEAIQGAESLARRTPLLGRAMTWAGRMALPRPVGERIGVPPASRQPSNAGPAAEPYSGDNVAPPAGVRGAIQKHSMAQMIHSLFDQLPKKRLSREDLALPGFTT